MIVDNPTPATNRGLTRCAKKRAQQSVIEIRGVSKGKTRAEILIVPGPVRLLPIGLPAGAVGDYLICGFSECHGLCPAAHKLIQALVRGNLISRCLVTRLQQRISQPRGNRQIWTDVPYVLKVKISFPAANLYIHPFPSPISSPFPRPILI